MLSEKNIYCTFFLNHGEFALSVSFIQEVINTPSSYSAMPLAPDYLKGLINLRGNIIPIIDLKKVLNLKNENESENKKQEQKIAVARLNGNLVGLLFDKTGEVFKSNSEEQSDFLDDRTSIIKGVFKKENGKRIVQILDVASIFCLQSIPKREEGNLYDNLVNNRGKKKQAISFLVGSSKCSIEISEIQEIIKINQVNESVLSEGNCIGTFDLRGVTVPVIDFAALLKYRETDSSAVATSGERRIVVMKIEKGLIGLLVDKVESIIAFYGDELKQFPVLALERMGMVKGCISIKDKEDVLLLDDKKILSEQEISRITHGHSKLYSTETENEMTKSSKSNVRQTLITFSIEQEYALNISDVREIIDSPEALLTPPGMPSHYRGILNLRGEMVMIVDSRAMYQKNKFEGPGRGKILIFKTEEAHFGIVVDSVQTIVNLTESEKIKLPTLMYRDKAGESMGDIVEAIQYKTQDEQSRVAFILDAKCMAKRVLAKAA